MFERVSKSIREKIRKRDYVMTFHARREMIKDALSIHDVESALLTGIIEERQRDKNTAEWKYRLRGEAIDGTGVEVVVKLAPTGKLVIITVFLD